MRPGELMALCDSIRAYAKTREKSHPTRLEDLIGYPGLVYVSTPYTLYPFGLSAAAYDAKRHTAHLIRMGIVAISPIAHGHEVARVGGLDPIGLDLWMAQNQPLMEACSAMVAVHLPGWKESRGMAHEAEHFTSVGKPVVEMGALP